MAALSLTFTVSPRYTIYIIQGLLSGPGGQRSSSPLETDWTRSGKDNVMAPPHNKGRAKPGA